MRARTFYRTFSLLTWAFVVQPILMLGGDWTQIAYYAGLGAFAAERGLFGAFVYISRLWEPIWVAQLAHQMQVEIECGGHPEYVREHYRHLKAVAMDWAEGEEPGVIRRAWVLRQEILASAGEVLHG